MLFKSKSQVNNEDSSTNFLSGLKEKKFVKNDISTKMKSETESFFINFKLGEKDSIMDNILINYSKTIENENKKKINLKQNFNYCKVNNYSLQNENDSFEIYDFNDETNVRYVLKNLSNLSCDKSDVGGGLSNIFVDLNANKEPIEVSIPDGRYTVVCCDGNINENGLGTIKGTKTVVDSQSALIFHD